jgi:hypothetical protein
MEGNGHVQDAGVIAPASLANLDGETEPGPPVPSAGPAGEGAVLEATRVVVGLVLLGLAAFRSVLERLRPASLEEGEGLAGEQAGSAAVADVASALIGMSLAAERRFVGATNDALARTAPVLAYLSGRPILGAPLRAVGDGLARWAERGRLEQDRSRDVAGAFLLSLVPEVVGAILEQVDLDDVVARVDLDRIIDRIDMERILGRVDVDGVVDRVDIDRIVDRIDLDAIVGRVDVNAVVQRVDLPGITEQVMDEVDISEIIRESTGSVTTQTVDALRYQGMNMDRFVARVVDRVLFRRGEGRDASATAAEGAEGSEGAAGPSEHP